MTQIYTSNTILATAISTNLNRTAGENVNLSAEISLIWIDPRSAQRFIVYRWQESADGVSWRDIPSGQSNHPLSVNLSSPTTLRSYLEDELMDLELSEFNIANNKKITANLEISNILFSQNNYKYRCLALLYNNTISSVESVSTTNNIELIVSQKPVDDPIGEFDIPWDPMDPQKVIGQGNLSIDHKSSIEIFKINKSACGSQWRIIEKVYNKIYLSGNIIDGSPVGLPVSYGPNTQSYPGYMELQFYCNNQWVAQEAWISLVGRKDHVFNKYHPVSSINVSMNGQDLVKEVRLADISNPLIIKPNISSLCNDPPEILIDGLTSSTSRYFSHSQSVGNPSGCETSIYGITTIKIPQEIILPATVTIVGSADDNLVVNGVPVNPQPCAASGPVNYSFVCDTDSFVIGVADNYGVGAGYNLKITFTSNITSLSSFRNIKKDTTNIISISRSPDIKVQSISSTQDWQDTGTYILNNSRMIVQATGSFRWNNNGDMATATGVSFSGGSIDNRFAHQSLIARIGLSGTPFYVGDYLKTLASGEGYLQFATNDTSRFDNIGSLSVTTTVLNPDPIGLRVSRPNPESYNSDISDNIFDKVSLLVGYSNNQAIDFSNNRRNLISTNFSTVSSPNLYNSFSGSYADGGYSIVDSDSSLSFDGDFTIEGWFYFLDNGGIQPLVSTYTNADYTGWSLALSNGLLYFHGSSIGYGGWPILLTSAFTPQKDTWTHIAVSRNGTTIRLFADGNIVGSLNSSLTISGGLKLEIGNYPYFGSSRKHLKGYVNEVRITKANSRYNSAFSGSLPNKPFPKQLYSPFKTIDISNIQKYATTIYDKNDEPLYSIIEPKNEYAGPFADPGDINVVFNYNSPYCTELTLEEIP